MKDININEAPETWKAAALAAAIRHFHMQEPDRAHEIARSILHNAIHWERYKEVLPKLPDEAFAERDHQWLHREIGARRFVLLRHEDETGVSGTGPVAEGVVFVDSGRVGMTWTTVHGSTCFYMDVDAVEHIHGHGGKTTLAWQN